MKILEYGLLMIRMAFELSIWLKHIFLWYVAYSDAFLTIFDDCNGLVYMDLMTVTVVFHCFDDYNGLVYMALMTVTVVFHCFDDCNGLFSSFWSHDDPCRLLCFFKRPLCFFILIFVFSQLCLVQCKNE